MRSKPRQRVWGWEGIGKKSRKVGVSRAEGRVEACEVGAGRYGITSSC
jgi:hypothetical protein